MDTDERFYRRRGCGTGFVSADDDGKEFDLIARKLLHEADNKGFHGQLLLFYDCLLSGSQSVGHPVQPYAKKHIQNQFRSFAGRLSCDHFFLFGRLQEKQIYVKL